MDRPNQKSDRFVQVRRLKTQEGLTRVAPIFLGMIMLIVGVLAAISPPELYLYHPAGEVESVTEHVTPARARTYGFLSAAFGAGLLGWAASPTRRKRAAIESYVWQLSQELNRRFGANKYYKIEQVDRAAESAGCTKAFIVYAHALFCDLEEFTAQYPPKKCDFTYTGLREFVGRRYFSGARDFDAATIVRMARQLWGDENTFDSI